LPLLYYFIGDSWEERFLDKMDFLILSSAVVSLFIFVVVKITVLRFLGGKKIIIGLIYAYFLTSLINFFVFFFQMTIVFYIISFLLYSLMAIIYVWLVLGIATTSLRIQLLVTIHELGGRIAYKKLLERYNKRVIIENRLQRLVGAGEIQYSKGYYYYNNTFSYFKLHMLLIKLMAKLYKVPRYR